MQYGSVARDELRGLTRSEKPTLNKRDLLKGLAAGAVFFSVGMVYGSYGNNDQTLTTTTSSGSPMNLLTEDKTLKGKNKVPKGPKGPKGPTFDDFDTDNNDKISEEEFSVLATKWFEEVDSDNDGAVTAEEFKEKFRALNKMFESGDYRHPHPVITYPGNGKDANPKQEQEEEEDKEGGDYRDAPPVITYDGEPSASGPPMHHIAEDVPLAQPAEILAGIPDIFNGLDKDADGKVNFDEFGLAVTEIVAALTGEVPDGLEEAMASLNEGRK